MDRDSYQVDHIPARQGSFKAYPIISDQITADGLGVVWDELNQVLAQNVAGDIVELGCYVGTSSLFIRRLLESYDQSSLRTFHVYDSFEGLPEKSGQDQNAAGVDFKAGKLYVSKKELLHQFHAANLQSPIVHKAWFDTLKATDLPEQIAFAFLDGDFYDSILTSLRLVWPKVQSGGRVLIDDFDRETLPGVTRAVTDYFRGKAMPHIRLKANIASITI